MIQGNDYNFTDVKVALAQIRPYAGDVLRNTALHHDYIEQAAQQKADAVFFPELSVTGYEPSLAHDLAFETNDPRLEFFQQASDQHHITIGVGVPMRVSSGVTISMVIFQPDKSKLIYAKQLLHADELPYFIPGTKQVIFHVGNTCVAPAICYESLQAEHAAAAVQAGAKLYLASVAKSAAGLAKAKAHYPLMARQHNMPVLMVNSVGPCDNFVCAGGTAVWLPDGTPAQSLGIQEGLLIV